MLKTFPTGISQNNEKQPQRTWKGIIKKTSKNASHSCFNITTDDISVTNTDHTGIKITCSYYLSKVNVGIEYFFM